MELNAGSHSILFSRTTYLLEINIAEISSWFSI